MARILVVDDEPDAVELLVEYLTIKGHTAITAANGAEALEIAKRLVRKNDVVLLKGSRGVRLETVFEGF